MGVQLAGADSHFLKPKPKPGNTQTLKQLRKACRLRVPKVRRKQNGCREWSLEWGGIKKGYRNLAAAEFQSGAKTRWPLKTCLFRVPRAGGIKMAAQRLPSQGPRVGRKRNIYMTPGVSGFGGNRVAT